MDKRVSYPLGVKKSSENCILHSDQGSVYTSYAYYEATNSKSIIGSMSRKGTPANNAPRD